MDHLTNEHARRLAAAIGPMRGYLCRLRERMERVGLDVREAALYRLVTAVEDALHTLWVNLHYRSCAHGVGRPPAEGE